MGALPPGRRRAVRLIPSWRVERARGRPKELFDWDWPDRRTVRVLEPTSAAVVLGSTQPDSLVRPGTPAVRRRSGGGAVLLEPGGLVWVDVFLPAGDALWEADVGRAFRWLGHAWATAVPGGQPHAGPLLTTAWSRLVCFAGLGPGEVTVEGAKVMGMSQRRTRAGALFQCAALLEWHPARLLDRMDLPDEDRRRGAAELAGVARGIPIAPERLVVAVLDNLP